MKIRQILFSALCSLLAVSCVEDVTEDVYIGPEGQTYFTLSFGAESTAVGTKVGFDPSVASPIYWTSTEDITLYDKSNTYKKYGDVIYTAPESGSSTASFEVSSFEVASGTKEISILATSGEVVPQNDGESIYYVTSETLILEHDGSDYNFDSYAGSLPFISPIERAAVTTTTSGVTSYDDDAPVLTMVPLFRAMVLDFCNLDNSYEDAEVGYIMASITLEDGEIYFYDKIAINAENFLYSAEGDNAINTAVKAAETDNDSTFETASITSRVKYKSPVSLADIKDLELPIVSLGTTADDMTGKEFTVAVMFYDSYDETDGILNSTLLAQYEERYTATSDFLYGKMDEIELKAENFAYDLNKAPSVTDVEAEAQGVVAPEIKVTWEYPAEIANAAGVEIAGVKIYYGTTADCEETPIDIAYDEQNLTKEYTLGVSETLGWATDYYIYVATYTDGYAEETPSSTVTATTVEQVDIVLDGDIYKIYTAKGLAAFSNLVNKNVTNDVVGLVTATSDGSDFTTFGESNSNINGQVMTTIDMTTYPDFEGITYYSGTFDGGNGLSEGSATNITIKNLTPENGNGLFNILSDGATIKNVTLTDIVATSSNAANIGAIASAIFFDATVDISYCEVSGSVSGEGDGTGGLVGCAFSDATLSDATLIIGNSTNNATVTINNVDYNSTRGLVGFVNDGVTITFTDCEDTVAGEYVSTAMESTTVGVAVNSSYDGIDIKWTAVAEGETGADDVVAVYYSVADENNYTMAPLTKLSAGIVSLAVGEELTADETYDIYVETKNYLWQSAVATNGGTSSDPVVVKVSSPAYDIVLNNGTYEIYTAEGLMAFAGIVNGGNGGTKPSDIKDNSSITWSNTANASANAKIVADIDMSGKEWTPIGSYAGTFDGGSESFFEIQNLEGANGLFSSTKVSSSASISNVILVDPIIECTTSFVSIGAIVGTLESSTSITNCVVKGGSVEASYSTCIVGALVGENLGSISSSSSSCSVTVEGNLYNGGTDSCLVGAGNGSVSADCYDNYTESEAAKAAEEATIASAIPMYTSTGSVSTVVVTLSFEDGEESVDAKKVYYSGTSNGSAKVGDENTVTLTLTADQTYTIYAVTTNYLEAETKSDEITVTTYGANTYSGVSLPAITATANTNANVITLSWELPTEGLSAELQELVVTYGSYAAETINRATLELGSTTMAATYVSGSGSGQTISYTGGYAPTSASSETIKVTGGSATISEVTADIELVGGVYQIYTVAGLLDFATIVNGVEGDEVTSQTNNSTIATRATAVPANPSANAKIMAPITFSYDNDNSEDDDAKWVSMVDYTGTFDGNTQEIKNLTGTNGLFASAIGATIKNVKLTSIDVVGTTGNIGGLIGSATGATISDCEVSGNVYGNGGGIGGLIGTGSGVITITDTTNSTIVNGDGSASNLGGLIGATTSNSTDVLVITDCRNTATIGNSANRSTVGGLGGYIPMAEGSKITRFTNTGAISGSANVGGVIGNIRTSAAVIDACENSGDVTSTGTCAGGIVGGYHNSGIYTITDTSNSGNISGTTTVGGIVGKAQIATITSSNGYTYNTGSVTATAESGVAGGIVGYNEGTVTRYINSGAVTINGTASNITNGISGTPAVGTYTDCSDSTLTELGQVNVTSVVAINNAVTITWAYLDDKYTNIKDVTIYYGTGSTYESVEVETNGSNSITSKTLYLDAETYYFYVEVSNDYGMEAATATGVTGEMSSSNTLSAVVSASTTYDLVYTSSSNTYSIYSAKGLQEFANIVNGSSTNSATAINSDATEFSRPTSADATANAVVATSINLEDLGSSVNWTSIGPNATSGTAYTGTFDGGNYEISNLYHSAAPEYFGLFGYTDCAKIQNVKLVDVDITTSNQKVGALVGYGIGNWSGISSASTDSNAAFSYARFQNYATYISNCYVSGEIESSTYFVAGIVGDINNAILIENTENNANITANGGGSVGGIIGANTTSSSTPMYITGCTNSGTITAKGTGAGGIGGALKMNANSVIVDCTNSGTVTSDSNYVGGIVGSVSSGGVTINNCVNDAIVTAGSTGHTVGGIAGQVNVASTFNGCSTTANSAVSGKWYLGNIVGQGTVALTIDGAYAETETSETKGTVTAINDTGKDNGAIIGAAAATTTISNYVNTGAIYNSTGTIQNSTTSTDAYCLVGNTSTGNVELTNCYDNYHQSNQ